VSQADAVSGDRNPVRGRSLGYLCFGSGDQVYLVHRARSWPSFEQVLAVRLVPGTMRTLAGHPLGDDVAAVRFDRAQPAEAGREDAAERRLVEGEVAGVAFPLTLIPGSARGFTVQVEVERELYLEIHQDQLTEMRAAHGVRPERTGE
jgi:hypothetical protein